jgi:hypothetical protein
MQTCTLEEILRACNAPTIIDYMSLDTEGSELIILSVFPFNRYQFRALTIEHNFSEPKRTQVSLLIFVFEIFCVLLVFFLSFFFCCTFMTYSVNKDSAATRVTRLPIVPGGSMG